MQRNTLCTIVNALQRRLKVLLFQAQQQEMYFLDITIMYEGHDSANKMTIQSNDYLTF